MYSHNPDIQTIHRCSHTSIHTDRPTDTQIDIHVCIFYYFTISEKKENFKSLAVSKEKIETTEFDHQRQATIAEALQAKEGGKVKTFGSKVVRFHYGGWGVGRSVWFVECSPVTR